MLLDKDPYSYMTLDQVYNKLVTYLFLVWQEGTCIKYKLLLLIIRDKLETESMYKYLSSKLVSYIQH